MMSKIYGVAIALLIVATILLITAAAAPNILTEGRRDRDERLPRPGVRLRGPHLHLRYLGQ